MHLDEDFLKNKSTPKRHTRIYGGKRHIWQVERLRHLAKNLTPREIPLSSIPDLDHDCWFNGKVPSMRDVARHHKRILEADLSYPVILNSDGLLMDGGHRCCKALVEGIDSILAVKFDKTPEPDSIELL